jgi:hypothetical protein
VEVPLADPPLVYPVNQATRAANFFVAVVYLHTRVALSPNRCTACALVAVGLPNSGWCLAGRISYEKSFRRLLPNRSLGVSAIGQEL